MDNWDDYRFFLAVAKAGSLSTAAQRLGVTQPTVGRRIHDMEGRLRVRLFDRLSHGYGLTEAGESILHLVDDIATKTQTIQSQITGQDDEPSGLVRVTCPDIIGTHLIAPNIGALRERHPQIEVELIVGVATLNLLRGEADIAMRIGQPPSQELVGKRVGNLHFGLYAAHSYLAAHGTPRIIGDLRDHIIIESAGELDGVHQAKRLRLLARGARSTLRCNDVFTQMAAVRGGVGILAMPLHMAAGEPTLRRLLEKDFNIRMELWVLMRRELRRTARIRAVHDFLVQTAEADKALLASGG